MILDDNTVVPSYLGVRHDRGVAGDPGDLTNTALRLGEVKDIVYPDDERSISKRFVEYAVEVQHREGNQAGTAVTYAGCIVANHFGGSADLFRYTLRKDDKSKTGDDGLGVGSKVLILCVNGQTTRAMIIGGVRDTKVDEKTVEKKADGHNLYFEFNGISFEINKSGEAKIQFRGPTKVDGTLDADAGADDKNGPTTIQILKNGNLKVYTKDEKQSLLIDHENKKAEFLFDEEWKVTVNKKVTESYGDQWNLDCGSSIGISAKSDIKVASSGGTWTMQCSGQSFIKSAGLQVGAATDSMMKGTTYRMAETQLHAKLMASLTALAAQLGVAGASINAACQPMKIPIAGPIIASALLQPAGVALTTSVGMITQMVAAITAFEAQSATYLSLVNKND